MRTITMVAHNRPKYTVEAIKGLVGAMLHPGVVDSFIDKVIFSIDPGNAEVVDVCHRSAQVISEHGLTECSVYVNLYRFGLSGNSEVTLKRAFEEHESDINLHLEDDAVITPDALLLYSWFERHWGNPNSRYCLMSLCNHRDFGRGTNPGEIPDDPSYMVEAAHITSPFAWVLTKHEWPWVRDTWNFKKYRPTGHDFSLSMAMRLLQKRTVHPVLSRCQNIGREGGSHETPETFDKTQLGIKYSDGSYVGDYSVVAKFPDEELQKLNDWMQGRDLEPMQKLIGKLQSQQKVG